MATLLCAVNSLSFSTIAAFPSDPTIVSKTSPFLICVRLSSFSNCESVTNLLDNLKSIFPFFIFIAEINCFPE